MRHSTSATGRSWAAIASANSESPTFTTATSSGRDGTGGACEGELTCPMVEESFTIVQRPGWRPESPADEDGGMDPTGQTETVEQIAAAVRALPGLRAKAPIALVADVLGGSDWEAGPGDDGAAVEAGEETLIVGGEVMLPAFVQADPFAAGVAAMLTNVNDLAAMGAEPLALVDTIVASEAVARKARSEEHTSELQSRLHLVCRL